MWQGQFQDEPANAEDVWEPDPSLFLLDPNANQIDAKLTNRNLAPCNYCLKYRQDCDYQLPCQRCVDKNIALECDYSHDQKKVRKTSHTMKIISSNPQNPPPPRITSHKIVMNSSNSLPIDLNSGRQTSNLQNGNLSNPLQSLPSNSSISFQRSAPVTQVVFHNANIPISTHRTQSPTNSESPSDVSPSSSNDESKPKIRPLSKGITKKSSPKTLPNRKTRDSGVQKKTSTLPYVTHHKRGEFWFPPPPYPSPSPSPINVQPQPNSVSSSSNIGIPTVVDEFKQGNQQWNQTKEKNYTPTNFNSTPMVTNSDPSLDWGYEQKVQPMQLNSHLSDLQIASSHAMQNPTPTAIIDINGFVHYINPPLQELCGFSGTLPSPVKLFLYRDEAQSRLVQSTGASTILPCTLRVWDNMQYPSRIRTQGETFIEGTTCIQMHYSSLNRLPMFTTNCFMPFVPAT